MATAFDLDTAAAPTMATAFDFTLNYAVVAGKDLDIKDAALFGRGSSDPFVVVSIDGNELSRTQVVKKSVNPVWNHAHSTVLPPQHATMSSELKFSVFDYDVLSQNDSMGEVRVGMDQLLLYGSITRWFDVLRCNTPKGPASPKKGMPANQMAGSLQLKLSLVKTSSKAPPPQQHEDSSRDSGGSLDDEEKEYSSAREAAGEFREFKAAPAREGKTMVATTAAGREGNATAAGRKGASTAATSAVAPSASSTPLTAMHDRARKLFDACCEGDVNTIDALVHDTEPHLLPLLLDAKVGPRQSTCLINAIRYNKVNVAVRLLKKHADPNVTDDEGYSALMVAASKGQLASTQILRGGVH